MAIIDVLKYDGPNNALVWKWRPNVDSKRDEELRLGTQLVVNQSQQALFIKGGQLLDIFEAGTHTLSTQNLPILSSLIGLAFGGQSPFKAEVYFINKAVAMNGMLKNWANFDSFVSSFFCGNIKRSTRYINIAVKA